MTVDPDRVELYAVSGPDPSAGASLAVSRAERHTSAGRLRLRTRVDGIRALVEATRPRHAVKNLLLLVAPASAGSLLDGAALANVATAFAAFWLTSGGVYVCNDIRDAVADRSHPRKARRPVASGRLAPRPAAWAGVLLIASGLGIGASLGLAFLGVVGAYVAVSALYVLWARNVAVLDLAAVASGFYLRAAGGAVAIGVPVSRWFATVAFFGSLAVVAGKRHSERMALESRASAARPTLARYSRACLRRVVLAAAAVTLAAYCGWALERTASATADAFFLASVVPFAGVVGRYLVLVARGCAEEPELLVFRDRLLLAATAAWWIVFGTAVTIG